MNKKTEENKKKVEKTKELKTDLIAKESKFKKNKKKVRKNITSGIAYVY